MNLADKCLKIGSYFPSAHGKHIKAPSARARDCAVSRLFLVMNFLAAKIMKLLTLQLKDYRLSRSLRKGFL